MGRSVTSAPKAAKLRAPPFFYDLMHQLVVGDPEMMVALTRPPEAPAPPGEEPRCTVDRHPGEPAWYAPGSRRHLVPAWRPEGRGGPAGPARGAASRMQEPNYSRIERGGNQTAIVFVHGLSGDYRTTWGRFPDLVTQDSELNFCDVVCWGYPTSLQVLPRLPFLGRKMPTVDLVADALQSDLDNPAIGGGYADLVLAGHSMGGLVIMKMLLAALERGRAGDLELLGRVRHLAFYATPTLGVQAPRIVAVHPQARSLAVDSELIRELTSAWGARVGADGSLAHGDRPIGVTAVVGLEDNAVTEESGRAFWSDVETAPGNHVEMCKPEARSHTSFAVLRRVVQRATLPQFIKGLGEVREANITMVREARREIYTVGSRSRDPAYLQAIEERLASQPRLVYYRALIGPPRRQILKDHLLRCLDLRDPADRSEGYQTIHLSLFEDTHKQPEIFLCGNERRCLVVLPSTTGAIGEYSTAVVFTDPAIVRGYGDLTKALCAAGKPLATPADVQALAAPGGAGAGGGA